MAFDSAVLVAFPPDDDPVHEVSRTDAHMTLANLGKLDDLDQDTLDKVAAELADVATGHEPTSAPVITRGSLGDSDSLFLDGERFMQLRSAVLAQPTIAALAEGQEHNDPWIPHLALAYGDDQADPDDGISTVRFDQIGLLAGDRKDAVPLKPQEEANEHMQVEMAASDRIPDGTFVTWPYRGTHGGGYVRGIRKPGKDSASTEYKIEQVDDHVSDSGSKEPKYVYHYGRVLTKADAKKWKAKHAKKDDPNAEGETIAMATETASAVESPEIPFRSVLVQEDVPTGDHRIFATDAIRWADLPLPLSYQKVYQDRHLGSVVVGRIDDIFRDGNMIKASGVFLPTDETQGVVDLVVAGALRGLSIDVDDHKMEMEFGTDDDGSGDMTRFTDARIRGATIVAIPAYAAPDSMISLGTWDDAEQDVPAKEAAGDEAMVAAASFAKQIDEGSWDGDASNYTPEQWYRATLIHLGDKDSKSDNKLPILTPSGKLSRAGVHAAAARINQVDAPADKIKAAKASLRQAYRMLDEDAPDAVKAGADELDQFATVSNPTTHDGPGWFTHPVDTQRLANYWTKGEGAAKIGWGAMYDFYRCELNLAPYVKPQYLAGYCANRHKDALGVWPGQEKLSLEGIKMSPQITLTASATTAAPPREWFEDPQLPCLSPLIVTDEGRVIGHAAGWRDCHIGEPEGAGVCTTPPRNGDGTYKFFRTGVVTTDDGDVPVGQITMGTGHAGPYDNAVVAASHYDNTGAAVADVSVGEDEFGIWLSGALRPGVTDEQIAELKAGAISGDWRMVGGAQEMIAALVVNVPGFPIPRVTAGVKDGRHVSLCASGMVSRETSPVDEGHIEALASAVVKEMKRQEANRQTMASLRRKYNQQALSAIRERQGI